MVELVEVVGAHVVHVEHDAGPDGRLRQDVSGQQDGPAAVATPPF